VSAALVAIPFGLAIGVSVGMLGAGGSVLAVPVLVYVLGQPVGEATTASLAVVTAAALAGAATHHGEGRVCWRHAAALTVAAVPGIFAGTALGDAVDPGLLLGAFAGVMIVAAVATWARTGEHSGFAERGRLCPPLQAGRDVLAGSAIGFLTGFFGVGGGFLIVPTLAMALGFRLRGAIGTSLAVVTATSVVGLAAHLLAGRHVDVPVTAAMAGACVVGAVGGALAAGRVPERTVGRGFALVVAAVAAYLLVSTALLGGAPGTG
jgi:uncharacterized membrane protein YfcA